MLKEKEIVSPTEDHRHPRLAEVALRTINAVSFTSDVLAESESALFDKVIQALHAVQGGDHADIILATLPELAVEAWNWSLPENSPTTVKSLLTGPYKDSQQVFDLCTAIVRLEACHHVPLVRRFVSQYVAKSDPVKLNRTAPELLSYGYIGLSNALKGYDPASQNTISTFAARRIVGAVQDGIRAESPVPKRLTTFVRAVEAAEEKLSLTLGRAPSREELEAELGPQARYLHLYPRLKHQASLDELDFYNQQSNDDIAQESELSAMWADVKSSLESVSVQHRQAFLLVYKVGLTVRETAKELGVRQKDVLTLIEETTASLRQNPNVMQWADLLQEL